MSVLYSQSVLMDVLKNAFVTYDFSRTHAKSVERSIGTFLSPHYSLFRYSKDILTRLHKCGWSVEKSKCIYLPYVFLLVVFLLVNENFPYIILVCSSLKFV